MVIAYKEFSVIAYDVFSVIAYDVFSVIAFKAVVKYVGGFWPIGVFFSGYGSFFFVPRRQTQTKASSCKYANS